MRVAVVGAGLAGLSCARVLLDAGHAVVVRERGRVVGGRMASRRLDSRYVDLGASYFVPRDPGFCAVADRWQQAGLAGPWTDRFAVWDGGLQPAKPGPTRWSATGGLRSLIEDLADGVDVQTSSEVHEIGRRTVDGKTYDAVVLAMPDPQALQLLSTDLQGERAALSDRAWQPVLAVAARLARRSWSWDGLFVHGSQILEWVADDGARRGDGAPVLVAHSTPGFAAGRLTDPQAAAPAMLDELARLSIDGQPELLHLQRWTYAKPVGVRDAAYRWDAESGVGLCGDGWGASKVEAAWLSGRLLGLEISGQPAAGAPGAGGC